MASAAERERDCDTPNMEVLRCTERGATDVKVAADTARRLKVYLHRSRSACEMNRTKPLDLSKSLVNSKVQDWCMLPGTRVSLPTNMNDTPVAMINVNVLRCSFEGKGYSGGTLVSEWQRKQSFAPNPRPGRITGDNRYPTEYAANFDPTTNAYTTRLQSIYGGGAYRAGPRVRPKKQRAMTASPVSSPYTRAAAEGKVAAAAAASKIIADGFCSGALGSSADPRSYLPLAPSPLNQKPSTVGWTRMKVPCPPESVSRTAYSHKRIEFQQLDPTSDSRARILIGSSVKNLIVDKVTAQLQATQARFTPTWGSIYMKDYIRSEPYLGSAKGSMAKGLVGPALVSTRRPVSAFC